MLTAVLIASGCPARPDPAGGLRSPTGSTAVCCTPSRRARIAVALGPASSSSSTDGSPVALIAGVVVGLAHPLVHVRPAGRVRDRAVLTAPALHRLVAGLHDRRRDRWRARTVSSSRGCCRTSPLAAPAAYVGVAGVLTLIGLALGRQVVDDVDEAPAEASRPLSACSVVRMWAMIAASARSGSPACRASRIARCSTRTACRRELWVYTAWMPSRTCRARRPSYIGSSTRFQTALTSATWNSGSCSMNSAAGALGASADWLSSQERISETGTVEVIRQCRAAQVSIMQRACIRWRVCSPLTRRRTRRGWAAAGTGPRPPTAATPRAPGCGRRRPRGEGCSLMNVPVRPGSVRIVVRR